MTSWLNQSQRVELAIASFDVLSGNIDRYEIHDSIQYDFRVYVMGMCNVHIQWDIRVTQSKESWTRVQVVV